MRVLVRLERRKPSLAKPDCYARCNSERNSLASRD